MGSLFSYPKFRAIDSLGNALVGGKVYTYYARSTTPRLTYQDKDNLTPNTNPVVLDANGEAVIFFGSGRYKVVLKNALDVVQWTLDDLTGIQSQTTDSDVDALSYGTGTYTHTTIAAALTALGTSTPATLVLRPGTWVVSANVDWSAYTNVQIKFLNGAILSHGAYTVKLANVEAGSYQIFNGTGSLKVNSPNVYWFGYVGALADSSVAINKAILADSRAYTFAKIRLPVGDIKLSSSITSNGFLQLEGDGGYSTILKPDAGVDAIDIYWNSTSTSWVRICDLSIVGGRRAIYMRGSGGAYYSHFATLERLRLRNQTAEAIYSTVIDIQTSRFTDIAIDGLGTTTYGIRLSGKSSANRNTFTNVYVSGCLEAGLYIEGIPVTYDIEGTVLINFVAENNYKYGAILENVNDVLFVGGHFETNGRTLTGGPYANIVLKGTAAYPLGAITMDSVINVPTGPNQGGLIMQVLTDYVSGPIMLRNNTFSAASIIDLGSFTTPTVLEIKGKLRPLITGTNGEGFQGAINLLDNGSFEHFYAGASAAPTRWTLYGGAAAARITGSASRYGVELTTTGVGQNLRQLGLETKLRPNTVYTLAVKHKVTALTGGASVLVQWFSGGVGTTLATYNAVESSAVRNYYTFKTGASITATCGILFAQYSVGAGSAKIELDDVMLLEGGVPVASFIPAPEDGFREYVINNVDTGWQTMTGSVTKDCHTLDTSAFTDVQLAQIVKGILDALIAHKLIGA